MSLQWFGIWGMSDSPSSSQSDLSRAMMSLRYLLEDSTIRSEFRVYVEGINERLAEFIDFWKLCKSEINGSRTIDAIVVGAPPEILDGVDLTLDRNVLLEKFMENAEEELSEMYDLYKKHRQAKSKKK